MWNRLPKASFCFLGWGIFGIWSTLMYRFPPVEFPGFPAFSNGAYEAVSIVALVIIAVVTRLRMGFAPLARHGWAAPLSVLLLVACTCLSFGAAAFGVESPVLVVCSLGFGGVGTALMMMLLSEFFGFIHPTRTVLYMAMGWLAASLVTPFFRVLPLGYLWVVMCLIPVVIALCLWRAYRTLAEAGREEAAADEVRIVDACKGEVHPQPQRGSSARLGLSGSSHEMGARLGGSGLMTGLNPGFAFVAGRSFSFPWLPLVPIVLCAVVKSVLMGLVPGGFDVEGANDTGTLLAALVVLGGLTLRGGDLNLRSLWKLGVAAMAGAVVLFALAVLVGGGRAVLGYASVVLATISYDMLFILTAAILANLSYRYGACALWLFSIEHVAHLVARNAGMLAVDALTGSGGGASIMLDGAFVGAAVVSMAVIAGLFARFSPDSLWGLSLRRDEPADRSERLGFICDELAERFSLTTREGEILFMCLQGKRPSAIAEELLIEVSTVRTHIKRIYAKLDVHSKDELRALAGL